jgi:hypothetical protein
MTALTNRNRKIRSSIYPSVVFPLLIRDAEGVRLFSLLTFPTFNAASSFVRIKISA